MGSIGMEITLPGGQEIESVHYLITGGPQNVHIEGDIDVDDLAATVSAVIGGLPEGGPYTVVLTADSTDDTVHCVGSAEFEVVAGQTTQVSVELSCHADDTTGDVIIDGDFNQCPVIEDFRVAPLSSTPNNPIDVSAEASDADNDTLSFHWSTSGGSFGDPNDAATEYLCAPGEQTVTVTVSDGDPECDVEQTITIDCVVLTCGNGQPDPNEQCDDGNNTNGDGCTSVCLLERCGDGKINNSSTEQCDDGNTNSGDGCSATCQNERCGDNIIQAPEQCDGTALPPGLPPGISCTPNCTLPAYCGDSQVNQPSEECDDGNTNDGDLCGNDCLRNLDPNSCDGCSQLNCAAFYSECHSAADDPTDLCGDIMSCVETSHCAQVSQEVCYCGTLSIGLCVALDGKTPAGADAGPCKAPIEAGAGLDGTEQPGDTGTKVSERYVDPRYPLGRAFRLVNCQRNNCATQCGLNP